MSLLDELGTYLQTQGIGTLGTDLFRAFLPDAPAAAVALIETGGLAPQFILDTPGVHIDQPSLQVLSRGPVPPAVPNSYDTARAKIGDVIVALGAISNTDLSGVRYLRCVPSQAPFSLGPDDQGRRLVACNFQVMKTFS